MIETVNIRGANNKVIVADIHFMEGQTNAPLIIYAHGFCGFKDWGNFNLIAEQFAHAGFCFVKFNFSHNGTTVEQPQDFADLDAFAANNFSIETEDLSAVINFFTEFAHTDDALFDKAKIGLLGHSMGGGIVLATAANNANVNAVATWASVDKFSTPYSNWDEQKIENWRLSGVAHYHNGRTGQDLPMHYQLYEDGLKYQGDNSLLHSVSKLEIPLLVCHGSSDTSVPLSAAENIVAAAKNARLFTVDSDHVFGRQHPYPYYFLPDAMSQVLGETIRFFKSVLSI